MLVLSRRIGETLVVGGDVKFTILGVSGNQVRIGIEAPKEIAVHREEVFQALKQSESSPIISFAK